MAPLLFVVFIVVPLIELAVIIQVGQVVGAWWTIAALVAISIVGAALVKVEGLRAWQRFRAALVEARIPTREVVDGALILFAGALMLTPGFLTDGLGLLLLFPPTRAGFSRVLRSRSRAFVGLGRTPAGRSRAPGGGSDEPIDVEVIHVERHRDDPDEPPAVR